MRRVARIGVIGAFGVTAVALACSSGGGTGSPQQTPPTPQPTPAAAAPTAPTAPAPAAVVAAGPSTLDSVYTADQAARGKDVYFGTCRSCHAVGFFTTPSFETHWKGKHLSDLYNYVLTRMPGNDPGSLSPEATADVLAYVLQLNRMPAGANELWPDADSLKKYRIDTKP